MPSKDDWRLWHIERKDFSQRETEGITKDMEALRAHILKLQEVCPKDKAGWPVGQALNSIDRLQGDYDRTQRYLDLSTK